MVCICICPIDCEISLDNYLPGRMNGSHSNRKVWKRLWEYSYRQGPHLSFYTESFCLVDPLRKPQDLVGGREAGIQGNSSVSCLLSFKRLVSSSLKRWNLYMYIIYIYMCIFYHMELRKAGKLGGKKPHWIFQWGHDGGWQMNFAPLSCSYQLRGEI